MLGLRSLRNFGSVAARAGGKHCEKSVFISQSDDIHKNLALEDWLYKNSDFGDHRVLLLWKNSPSVVIGRHQNLWSEVDTTEAQQNGIALARRNSGGGTVYHDSGNLNCTFFTPRNEYNRKNNLEIIKRGLGRLGINVDINCKDDLTIQGSKISGTAAKLGKNAYHHCTLLVESDLKKLSKLLNPNTEGIVSRATKSVKSPVDNLKNHNDAISVANVLTTIGYEFLRSDPSGNDQGESHISQQRGFKFVNPTNEWFPGLDTTTALLKSWEWNYGKTPEFSINKSFPGFNLELKISKGFIDSVVTDSKNGQLELDLTAFLGACHGRPFSPEILSTLESLIHHDKKAEKSSSQSHSVVSSFHSSFLAGAIKVKPLEASCSGESAETAADSESKQKAKESNIEKSYKTMFAV